MEQSKLQLSLNRRRQIHDLILRKHASGLSPPEEAILEKLEATELSNDRVQSDDCPGFFIQGGHRT